MKYISSEEMAKKWGISGRRVIFLANEGRIPNAMQVGMRWLIPENAKKPTDGRTRAAKEKQEKESFRLPLFINYKEDDYNSPLSEEEKLLRKAQLDFNAYNLEDAKEAFMSLAASNNTYIRITAVMHLCLIMIELKDADKYSEFKRRMLLLLSNERLYQKEMMLMKYMLDAIMGSPKSLLEDFAINPDYSYHPSSLGLLSALSIFTAADGDISSISALRLDSFEAMCRQMEYSGQYFEAQLLHIQLIFGYQMQGKNAPAIQHMKSAINIALERNLVYLIVTIADYVPEIFKAASLEYPPEFIERIRLYSRQSDEGYTFVTRALGKVTIYSSLSEKDYRFVYLASQGYNNKKIAELLDTSEFYVSKRFSEIYRKLQVKGKVELKRLFTETVL